MPAALGAGRWVFAEWPKFSSKLGLWAAGLQVGDERCRLEEALGDVNDKLQLLSRRVEITWRLPLAY